MGKILRRKELFLYGLVFLLIVGCRRDSNKPLMPQVVGEVNIAPYGPKAVAANPNTGNVYILAGSAIAILNDNKQVALVQTEGKRLVDLAVDEEEGWVYVANQDSHDVTVLKDLELVGTVNVPGEEPHDVAIEPNNGWAYVVTGYEKRQVVGGERKVDGKVSILKGTEIIGSVPLGRVLPTHVVADPVSGYVYVGAVGGVLAIISGMEEVARFELGLGIDAMDVNPGTGEVYAIAGQDLYQLKETELIASIDLVDGNGSLMNMRVNPTTGDVYIINSGWEVIIVRNSTVIGRLDVGSALQAMTVDPLTGNVYVADFYEDKVTVINGTEVIGSYDVGWYPYGLGVNPANGWVYVSNTNSDTITVLGFE
ncbi:MAG: hypothetical protein MN733_10580 [Nitrososphaera sp.]|nr:hypothetical protein [Nitrososphaera sp.]